jgi:hypothetical protein
MSLAISFGAKAILASNPATSQFIQFDYFWVHFSSADIFGLLYWVAVGLSMATFSVGLVLEAVQQRRY